ncbi:DUF4275 family protein [Cytobacillus gottheilii]|uniref:DUF4275 family protein n=1 Tax=Cytobacillus gottheilii TaxID=859144 RepID=UPI00083187BC|nr:DUF4275 family protein [Cytobacillus gottheilii]
MRDKRMKKIEIPKWGNYLRRTWRERFGNSLSKEEQDEIWVDDFLWHICSWDKGRCLKKEKAITAFLQQTKPKCTIFYQFNDDAYLLENADTLLINDLPYIQDNMDYNDLYVMDWKGKWTFVMTHEPECGPYFIQID